MSQLEANREVVENTEEVDNSNNNETNEAPFWKNKDSLSSHLDNILNDEEIEVETEEAAAKEEDKPAEIENKKEVEEKDLSNKEFINKKRHLDKQYESFQREKLEFKKKQEELEALKNKYKDITSLEESILNDPFGTLQQITGKTIYELAEQTTAEPKSKEQLLEERLSKLEKQEKEQEKLSEEQKKQQAQEQEKKLVDQYLNHNSNLAAQFVESNKDNYEVIYTDPAKAQNYFNNLAYNYLQQHIIPNENGVVRGLNNEEVKALTDHVASTMEKELESILNSASQLSKFKQKLNLSDNKQEQTVDKDNLEDKQSNKNKQLVETVKQSVTAKPKDWWKDPDRKEKYLNELLG